MSQKKSFTDNPALQFISTVQENEIGIEIDQPQETQPSAHLETETQTGIHTNESSVAMKPNPLYIETKSKRVQLLMQPSLYQKLKDRAAKEKTSVNDLVHSILLGAVSR